MTHRATPAWGEEAEAVQKDAVSRSSHHCCSAPAATPRSLTRISRGIATLLIDLDGVLYVEEQRVPGSVEALKRSRVLGVDLGLTPDLGTEDVEQCIERFAATLPESYRISTLLNANPLHVRPDRYGERLTGVRRRLLVQSGSVVVAVGVRRLPDGHVTLQRADESTADKSA